MITVYVLVTFYDENGVHEKNSICQVKEENFDPKYMKKLEAPTADAYTKAETDALLDAKQDDLTAGTNISIDDDVISATDTGDTVSVTQVQTTGTKIATVTVNSVGTDIYAPAGGSGGSVTVLTAFDPNSYQNVSVTNFNTSNTTMQLTDGTTPVSYDEIKAALANGPVVINVGAQWDQNKGVYTVLAAEGSSASYYIAVAGLKGSTFKNIVLQGSSDRSWTTKN